MFDLTRTIVWTVFVCW